MTNQTVQTWLVSRDTRRLLDFIRVAFHGDELACIATEDGTIVWGLHRVLDGLEQGERRTPH